MVEQKAFTVIFTVFFLFTCRDMFFGHSSGDAEPDLTKPLDHLGQHQIYSGSSHEGAFQAVPRVKVQYCHSCGYKHAFDEFSKLITYKYPEIKVEGEYHQPNWLRAQLVNLLFISKIAILAMIYMDINPFTYLQMDTPRIWATIMQSKVPSSIIILFVTNSIESSMMSTGAFEIFYNDMPAWSKLATGRMPSIPELEQIIGAHYKLGEASKIGQFIAA